MYNRFLLFKYMVGFSDKVGTSLNSVVIFCSKIVHAQVETLERIRGAFRIEVCLT